MRNIWTIASKEYDQYFASPIAYLVMFVILFVVGIFFYLQLQGCIHSTVRSRGRHHRRPAGCLNDAVYPGAHHPHAG